MNKDYKVYVHYMLDAIATIEGYMRDLTQGRFWKIKLVQDGVIRNLEIIGEAAKQIPQSVRGRHPQIGWRDIDIVLELKPARLKSFIEIFHNGFYVEEESIAQKVKRRGMFNFIHKEYAYKVDFIGGPRYREIAVGERQPV